MGVRICLTRGRQEIASVATSLACFVSMSLGRHCSHKSNFLSESVLCRTEAVARGAHTWTVFSFLRTTLVQTSRTILLYGHDEVLLMTRARVLERAGFRTSMACELREIPQLLDELRPDLLLLCHSLSRTECVVAGMVGKNHRAALRTLLLVSNSCIGARDYGMSEVADEVFNSLLDPEKLVAKVRSMLEAQPQSRLWITYRQGVSSLARTN
jgi:hypothetical protein